MDEVNLDDVRVLYIESSTGPQGAPEAFDKLESLFASLKGRKFYGTFKHPVGIYRACISVQAGDDAKVLGLAEWVIPGGKYARRKMENWQEHRGEIGPTFESMAAGYGERNDSSRPSIEFYRSQKELVLYLPIR